MYNLESLQEIANGDDAFVVTLIKAFIEEVPSDVSAMNDAVANGNPSLAYQFSHKLKPNLKTFGLEVDEEVETIELWSKDEVSKDKAVKAANTINDTVNSLISELEKDFDLG